MAGEGRLWVSGSRFGVVTRDMGCVGICSGGLLEWALARGI